MYTFWGSLDPNPWFVLIGIGKILHLHYIFMITWITGLISDGKMVSLVTLVPENSLRSFIRIRNPVIWPSPCQSVASIPNGVTKYWSPNLIVPTETPAGRCNQSDQVGVCYIHRNTISPAHNSNRHWKHFQNLEKTKTYEVVACKTAWWPNYPEHLCKIRRPLSFDLLCYT